jgi:hypothetical protein
MAYLFSKIAAGLFGVWGVFVVSGANVGFYDPQPIPAPSSANTVYEGLEQPPEALQQPVEATTTTTITTIAGCDDVVNLAQTLGLASRAAGNLALHRPRREPLHALGAQHKRPERRQLRHYANQRLLVSTQHLLAYGLVTGTRHFGYL